MANRYAGRLLAAALPAAAALALGCGTAHAQPATSPAHVAPPPGDYHGGYDGPGYSHHFRHHYHPNCNNDPDSEFAMDPDVCPPSKNADAYGPYR